MNQLGNEYSNMCANWGNYPGLANPAMVKTNNIGPIFLNLFFYFLLFLSKIWKPRVKKT